MFGKEHLLEKFEKICRRSAVIDGRLGKMAEISDKIGRIYVKIELDPIRPGRQAELELADPMKEIRLVRREELEQVQIAR